uniref:Reverse transcriptase domain-containing protein n=2 Tax=Erpetoichthys calabaricus TaxID=27687 RepID=A0A8C4TH24_ERPCA
MSILITNYDALLIVGDFNFHVDNQCDQKVKEFMNLLDSFDLRQLVNQPTHKAGHTLDLVITKGLKVDIKQVIDTGLSDHFLLLFNIEIMIENTHEKHIVKKRFFDSSATLKLTNILTNQSVYSANYNSEENVNSKVERFNTKVRAAVDIVAPEKTVKKSSSIVIPWKTQRVSDLKRTCRRAERKWRKTKLTIDYEILKVKITEYNNTVRLERRCYFSKIINNNASNPRVLFSTIDHLLNPGNSKECLLSTSSKTCEAIAVFFNQKINDIRNNIVYLPNTKDPPKPQYSIINKLESFTRIDLPDLHKIISQMKPSTCALDPIPTNFFKEVSGVLIDNVLDIVNSSLDTGVFPDCLKTAVIKPLLKKNNLDPSALENYRPISNLPFLSKILEKAVIMQLNEHLNKHAILDKFQSGFRTNHSTETALVKVVNDLRVNADRGHLSVLILLDLSAAFDTIDHNILKNRLSQWVGLSGSVLNWFESYLAGRKFFVSCGNYNSKTHDILYGVPQGSILGPLLFSIYMLPLGQIISGHNVSYHSYADDTQLYLSIAPDDPKSLDSLTQCLTCISEWMNSNFLKLNKEKTEILVIGNNGYNEAIRNKLDALGLKVKSEVKSLGVTVDCNLNFKSHINKITRTAFFHLRNIAKVRPLISSKDAEKLVHAFVFSRLDYCNALLSGLPKKDINRLQLVQNAAARILTRKRKSEHISPVLMSLHWLPVSFRIDFKILLMVYKALNNLAPSYISECLTPYIPNRNLRSSTECLLRIPRAKLKRSGEAAFCCYAPKIWNSLPVGIRQANTVEHFKKLLKTHYFNMAFS